jgi:hypothetical protein
VPFLARGLCVRFLAKNNFARRHRDAERSSTPGVSTEHPIDLFTGELVYCAAMPYFHIGRLVAPSRRVRQVMSDFRGDRARAA